MNVLTSMLLLICTSAAFGEPSIQLFKKGKPIKNYDALVATLQTDDILTFGDTNGYRILGVLGEGTTTKVLKVTPLTYWPGQPKVMALRIPLKSGLTNLHTSDGKQIAYIDFLRASLSQQPVLERNGVPSPELFRSYPGQYMAMELIGEHETLRSFLLSPPSDPLEKKQREEALIEFAKKTSGISRMTDFHSNNIIYEKAKKRWLIIDWNKVEESNVRIPTLGSPHVIGTAFLDSFRNEFIEESTGKPPTEPAPEWIQTLFTRIDREIYAERKKGSPVHRCLSAVTNIFRNSTAQPSK